MHALLLLIIGFSADDGRDPAEIREILKAVCPASGPTQSKDGRLTGCRHCPRGTELFDVPPWELDHVIAGHFTSPAADERLVIGSGCEPHSYLWGGAHLVRRQGTVWTRVSYRRGLAVGQCLTFQRRDGRDVMVCQSGFSGSGFQTNFVYTFQFLENGRLRVTGLFALDDSTVACGGGHGQESAPYVEEFGTIDSLTMPDLNDDGIPDLEAHITNGSRKLSEAEYKSCIGSGKPAWVPKRAYILRWVFDGAQFVPTPKTRRLLVRFPATGVTDFVK